MKARISILSFAALAAAAILSGCYTLPDGAVVEVTGAEVVENVMREQGDGLSPLDSATANSQAKGSTDAPPGGGEADAVAESDSNLAGEEEEP